MTADLRGLIVKHFPPNHHIVFVVMASSKLGFPLLLFFVLLLFVIIASLFYNKESMAGGYSDWLAWGNCSHQCGNGTRFRIRRCDNPAPGIFGSRCSHLGSDRETSPCSSSVCPVDGQFGPWNLFSVCDKTCGGGVQKRVRLCNNPAPASGGKPCEGITEETHSCKINPCPVDGGFSDWSPFGACSVTCGFGKINRTRVCNKPEPSYGGKLCDGPTSETQECKQSPCPQSQVPTTANNTATQPNTTPPN